MWEEIQARRWNDARGLLADDLLIYWPHTGELIKGAANYIALNQRYPAGWSIEVLSALGDGTRASIEARVPHETLGVFFVTGFYELSGGLVRKGTEYWVTEKAEAPPAWRAALTERV